MTRFWSIVLALLIATAATAADAPRLPTYPAVVPGVEFRFPADHGAHPEFRTEWWYITGWLEPADGPAFGFQVTFFRTRPSVDQDNPSAFAAKQVLFAHAAISDPASKQLLHDQRASRAGFGIGGGVDHRHGRRDRQLESEAHARRPHRHEGRGQGFRARSRLRIHAADPAARREGLQQEGPASRTGELLLQHPASASVGERPARQSHGRGEGHRVARSRMVVDLSRSRARSVGTGSASISTTAVH